MKDIVIVEAVRSAVGRALKGSLANKRPDEMAGEVIRGLLARVPQVKPSEVDDLVLGCAMPEGEQGLNIARVVGLLGGLPIETGGQTINRFCSSGLQAIAIAAGQIALGSSDVVVAGGLESMSMVPMTGNKLSVSPEAMEKVAAVYTPMGITAENVAKQFGITREQQDAFALNSQKKASAAIEKKVFEKEIVPVNGVRYVGNEKQTFEFKVDEMPRPDTTLEGLASLKNARSLVAPRVRAARINVGSVCSSAARTLLTTNGSAPIVAATTAPACVKTIELPVSDSYAWPRTLRRPSSTST